MVQRAAGLQESVARGTHRADKHEHNYDTLPFDGTASACKLTTAATLGNIHERVPIVKLRGLRAGMSAAPAETQQAEKHCPAAILGRITMRGLKRAITRYDLPIKVTRRNGIEMLVDDPRHRWAILRLLEDLLPRIGDGERGI